MSPPTCSSQLRFLVRFRSNSFTFNPNVMAFLLRNRRIRPLLWLCLLPGYLLAQDRQLTGRVLSSESNAGVPGATVALKGSTTGTITDASGNFRLNLPSGTTRIIVSSVGYETKEVAVGAATNLTITLTATASDLSEVVVIGYGSKEKRDLTGAISSVGAKDISKSIAQAPELAMQGRMAGVFVSTPGGSPNARPQVRIRGVGTFGNAEPLYVVDGVPLTEYGSGSDGAQQSVVSDIRGNVNVLSMINPNDIESISVLKDASAAAIYGVRAANGVVLITTKKGQSGAPRVEVSASAGVSNIVKKYDMLDTPQFVALYREAYANNPNEAKNLPGVFNPSDPNYLGNSATYDWQTPLKQKNAKQQDYSVRISGGNDNTTYYVSGGYSYNESTLIGNNSTRYSFAGNLSSKVSKYLSVGATYRITYTDVVDNTQGDLRYAAETSPWQPIYDPNGYLGYAPSGAFKFKPNPALTDPYNPGTRPQYLPPEPPFVIDQSTLLWGPETNANIYARMKTNDTRYNLLRNLGTAFVQLEPLPGLRFKGTLSIDYLTNRRNQWSDFNDYLFSQTPGNPYTLGDGTSKGSYGERHARNFNLVKEFSINYARSFGQHNLDVLLNAMDQRYTYEFLGASSSQLLYADPSFRNINNVVPYSNAGSFRDINALQGYLARLSYNYDNRYYLDATVRRDGASRFAPGYKWGTFPAVSAAWRISKEPFMEGLTWITDLKLRGGWGQAGNQETRSFAYLSLISTSPDYSYGSGNGNAVGRFVNGVSLPDFPVQDLSWETVTTTNAAFDAQFLGRRLSATVEYYERNTAGLLQGATLAASVGNQNQPVLNIASVRNSGIELQLGWNDRIGDFGYSISGNLTTVKNRVTKLYKDTPFGGEFGRIEVGRPLFYLWGYKVGGIFQNQAEIDAYKAGTKDLNNNNNFAPGDMYFQDVNTSPTDAGKFPTPGADGKVNTDDRTYLGSTIPGFYYGLNLGANYKNFDLSIFFQGVGDVVRYNGQRANFESMASTGSNQLTSVLNRWTPSNPSTTMPRAVRSDPAQNNRTSDRFVESAAFTRLKNVQIGYNLPGKVASSLGFLRGLRLYVAGTNVLTFTKWRGLDPEDANRDGSIIPPARTFSLGLNATF
jgi:TonB-linked SusC/RagA family outer membrane protein